MVDGQADPSARAEVPTRLDGEWTVHGHEIVEQWRQQAPPSQGLAP